MNPYRKPTDSPQNNTGPHHKDGNHQTNDSSSKIFEKKSFRERISDVKTSRWIRFGIVSLLFFLWVIWMGNPWLLLIWFLLFDIYITAYIPWGWWKKTSGPTRSVMAWVDAIVYALVLVYIIFAFIGQNYMIPSSSLEKSLLVGDYLWVNKSLYGPRVPQTPLHFPLAQHTMPVINTKSYLENPQLSYHRLPGIRKIERGDIVVFNYPQGDTVPLKLDPGTQGDFYQESYRLKMGGVENPLEYMRQNPQIYGEVIWRPVDRRENYVKRAVGLPGERLMIRNDTIFINGSPIAEPDHVQYKYIIPATSPIAMERWADLGIRLKEMQVSQGADGLIYYVTPLTYQMKSQVEKWKEVEGPLIRETDFLIENSPEFLEGMFPIGNEYGWTRPNMGEFWIPERGVTLHLTLNNLPVYERAIRVYEGNDLEVKDGKIYINGKQTDYYTFKLDYYWMMGDNRDSSADSRYWGFVPEDHIVGTPMVILFSMDEEKGLFDGKIRWNRILRDANPDDKWQKSGK